MGLKQYYNQSIILKLKSMFKKIKKGVNRKDPEFELTFH